MANRADENMIPNDALADYVECDGENVQEFVSVRNFENVHYVNNSLLGRVLALAKRVIQEDDEDGLLAQILRHNPLHLLTPDKLLLVRRVLAAMCRTDVSSTVDKLLHLLVEK